MRKVFNGISKYFKGNPDAVGPQGFTQLQQAVANNDLNKVNSLIKAGANVNIGGKGFLPPLHAALRKDYHAIVLALVKAGANPDVQDILGQTPLHHAVEKGQEIFILTLLKLGADPNIKDAGGRTPLHLVPLTKPEIIHTLAKYNARINEQDNEGNIPLHRFLEYPKMVEQAMTDGADPNIRNHKGISPYMMMLNEKQMRRYPETLTRMVFLKGDLASANGLGETVLHLAARLEMEDVFLNVVKAVELSLKDGNGNNVLHLLVRTRNTRMIARALERAPFLIHETNGRGCTPMTELVRLASKSGTPFDVKLMTTAGLLLDAQADPDSRDENGMGLLHHAVIRDQTRFVEELLLKRADPNLADKKGKNALHYAIEKKNLIAMDILLERGADPDRVDERGWTILDLLAKTGDRDSPMVQRLIVAGGQYKKQLPLHPEMMRYPNKTLGKKNYGGAKPSGGADGGLGGGPKV